MSEQIGEIIGAFVRVLFFVLVGVFFYARLCGIEDAINNLAATQNKIYLQCGADQPKNLPTTPGG